MSSNPSLMVQVPLGALTPWAEADEADDLAPWRSRRHPLARGTGARRRDHHHGEGDHCGKREQQCKALLRLPQFSLPRLRGATIAPEHTFLSLSRRKTKPISGIGLARAGRRPPSSVSRGPVAGRRRHGRRRRRFRRTYRRLVRLAVGGPAAGRDRARTTRCAARAGARGGRLRDQHPRLGPGARRPAFRPRRAADRALDGDRDDGRRARRSADRGRARLGRVPARVRAERWATTRCSWAKRSPYGAGRDAEALVHLRRAYT